MKISILGLHSDINLGDPLICQTVKSIYQRIIDDKIEWEDIDLRNYFGNAKKSIIYRFLIKVFWRITYCRIRNNRFLHEIRILFLSHDLSKQVKGSNLAIIAGGGIIHYKCHDYIIGVAAFIRACKIHDIPVIINAVGIEGFDADNAKCVLAQKYLQYDNVKAITTRDDIATLNNKYLQGNKRIYTEKVVDPAIFCSDFFDIQKNPTNKIGIGLIRGTIYKDFKLEYTPEQSAQYYADLYLLCKEKSIDVEFFTNGLHNDTDIIPLIESIVGEKLQVQEPTSPKALIKLIASYEGIITARMHSCIIAYALGVPAVATVWCEKLDFFGNLINNPQCFIPINEITAELALQRLEKAMQTGYDEHIKNELKTKHLATIHKTLNVVFTKTCIKVIKK